MTSVFQEVSEIVGIDETIIVSIDSPEDSVVGVVVSELKISLVTIFLSLKIDFFLQNFGEISFDVPWKVVESSDSEGWSIEGHVSEEVVLAGEHDLDEILEGQSPIFI